MVIVTRTVTVAAGVFAPGHLGELTRYRRSSWSTTYSAAPHRQVWRTLPVAGGVYFVLALALFPRLGYARVWASSSPA